MCKLDERKRFTIIKLCDNNADCTFGADEHNCNELVGYSDGTGT